MRGEREQEKVWGSVGESERERNVRRRQCMMSWSTCVSVCKGEKSVCLLDREMSVTEGSDSKRLRKRVRVREREREWKESERKLE